jgi:16S rRNA (adenine1518-N6/adenine1519-N6)-dimethyltransferase
VEVDRRLLEVLSARLAGRRNVRVVEGDALRVDLAELLLAAQGEAAANGANGAARNDGVARRKVVANVPYNIAAPLLVRLLEPALSIRRLVVTVQREVAERVAAAAGTAAYGRLTLAVQYRASAHVVARLPPGAFLPAPDVESAVLLLVPHERLPVSVDDEAALFQVVAAGFGHRRKTLANALSHGLGLAPSAIDAACRSAGVDPRARAETLSLKAFAALTDALYGTERSAG